MAVGISNSFRDLIGDLFVPFIGVTTGGESLLVRGVLLYLIPNRPYDILDHRPLQRPADVWQNQHEMTDDNETTKTDENNTVKKDDSEQTEPEIEEAKYPWQMKKPQKTLKESYIKSENYPLFVLVPRCPCQRRS